MTGHWKRLLPSLGLLLLLLVVAAAIVPLLGGAVLLPQSGLLVWVIVGFALFLGVQLLIFKALNLRSRADEPPEEKGGEDRDERDWRAWRG
jgi:hypothetical protein